MIASSPFLIKAASAESATDVSSGTVVDLSSLPRVKQKLVAPPFVHEHEQIATSGPKIVEFEMTIIEKEVEVDDGVYLQAMTFDGSMPGPMMVVHEGDYLELTLYNPPENILQHNIDFHASTGAFYGCGCCDCCSFCGWRLFSV